MVQLSPVVQDPAGAEDVLTYSWEVIASNGQAVADPMSPTLEFVASDDGSYVVTITVTDDDGALGSDTVAITVDNVAPLVAATLPLLLDEGESFQLLGSFVDPGADTHVGSIDFGDGRVEELRFSGQAFSLGHRFGDDGTYDVEVMVSDDEGGSGNQSFTVTVNDVAPLLEISGPASALVGAPYQLNFSVTEPGNGSLLQWSVNWGDGTLEMLSGSTEQAEHTYTAPGERTIEVSASDEDGTYLAPSVSVSVVPPAFQVLALTPNPSGFDVSFNRGFDSALPNLYDTETGGRGLADVTLVGDTVGGVAGSLVIGADALSFVATGDVLVPDTYTVELRSATDGFRDKFGEFLDGDMDSIEGGDYRASFSVGPLPSVVISVDDFMRGPGQSVDLPAAAQGIPLRVGDAAGIESLELQISHDPSLLVVEGMDLGAGVVTGSLSLGPQTVPGQLHIVYSSATALAPGELVLGAIRATVPSSAPYAAKHVLTLHSLVINGGAISGLPDRAIHLVGYLGDTSAGGAYSSLDGQKVLRVALGADAEFEAYPLVDPVLVADITMNGQVTVQDATRLLQEVVGADRPEIPPYRRSPASSCSVV